MGNVVKSWYDYFFSFPECKILLGGLDAAGKTTMLYRMKTNEPAITVIPTVGFNVESLKVNNMNLTLWDIGGRDKIFPLYRHYFDGLDAFIIVVDSQDSERFPYVIENVLHFLFDDEKLVDVLVLIFANKQDLKGAKSCDEIVMALGLNEVKQKWKIQPCVATEGIGLQEGFNWIAEELKSRKK